MDDRPALGVALTDTIAALEILGASMEKMEIILARLAAGLRPNRRELLELKAHVATYREKFTATAAVLRSEIGGER